MTAPKDDVRATAVGLIYGVTDQGTGLNEQITRGALASLAPANRARATRLATAVLRQVEPIDKILKPFLRRSPPAYVLTILRLATLELLAEGASAHGVVNEAVSLTRAAGRKCEGFAGLVNAVLRKVAMLPCESLTCAAPQTLPPWLRGRLMSAYGKAATMAMERAHAGGAPIDLTPKAGASDHAARLGAHLLPTGSLRLATQAQVSELPGFASGDWWVQDAAAALPARALNARPGERVLDLCAAPGGKTLQLAAAGANVTALDLSPARMGRVSENLKRCGLTAQTIVADAMTWEPDGPFDAILLDAPCSATGTIRRHPDLPFVRDPARMKDLFALQSALLDRAISWLRPGARLVYATCSLLPDEGERQIAQALARNPDMRTEPQALLSLPGIAPEWVSAEGGLRLRPDFWPDLGGLDGFFIAVLRRAQAV